MLLLLTSKHKERDLLNGALVKLPLDILQKAYEAKVLLAAVKQHQEVELTTVESVIEIVKNSLSPRSSADLEDDCGYYHAIFVDELVQLTVAEAQMQQFSLDNWTRLDYPQPPRQPELLSLTGETPQDPVPQKPCLSIKITIIPLSDTRLSAMTAGCQFLPTEAMELQFQDNYYTSTRQHEAHDGQMPYPASIPHVLP
ncbi:hypothetical protein L210DRAFT_3509841 [Boletus edulis BED1]|uniref:Uncharacterized protein n=1 Tax=Boletus edulis BED1 TaxID=1328754 RepID=A0AAD4G7E6_BOLED|nr:hypothetical protein L210DRAFT_3509841 [Boletus edulis BED1]